MAKWLIKNNKADIKAMAKALNISEIMAKVLVNRNINTTRLFNKYINPNLNKLRDFTEAKDVNKAIDVLDRAYQNNSKIFIYGDYDADGVSSTVILLKGLRGLGFDADFYIPDRVSEGYGLNCEALDTLKEQGAELVILCDNGIASVKEIDYASQLGLETIIIDHHEPGFMETDEGIIDLVPKASAVIDPKQRACPYPFKSMCAAGLCYRFITVLYEHFEKELPCHDELLIFAAIATFCDIVDLIDENRIIAKNGLDLLNNKGALNIGLDALLEERLCKGKHISEFTIGFVIGPCINAGGRLETASKAVELFIEEDKEKAREYAKYLSGLNEERKSLTQKAASMAVEEIENSDMSGAKVYFIYNPEIHESIAGIVAGRIKEKYHHPVIVFTGEGEVVKGSARSIEGYNIYEGLYKAKELFIKFGGHAMAAGMSLLNENLEELYIRLNEDCNLSEEDFDEIIRIDAALPLNFVTYKLAQELNYLSPFGKGNHEPIFGTKGLKVWDLRVIEDKDTIIFTFRTEDGRYIKGLLFGKYEYFAKSIQASFDEYDSEKILNGVILNINLTIDAVYYININEYNNNVSVQMNIKDFRISK